MSAPSPMAVVEKAMLDMLVPSTEIVAAAEAVLNTFLRNKACVEALMSLIQRSPHPAVRQMSGLFLRKKINTYWDQLPKNLQNAIKQAVLELLTREPEHLVRLAIAGVIGALAKHQFERKEWVELPSMMKQCAESPNPQLREVAMLMFYRMTESIGTHMQSDLPAICSLFERCLGDQDSPKVRIMALKAVGCMVEYLSGDESAMHFQRIIPNMLAVLQQCLASFDEEVATRALNVITSLVAVSQPIVTPFLAAIIRFCLEVSTKMDLDLVTRDAALIVVQGVIEHRSLELVKLEKGALLIEIIEVSFKIASDYDPEREEDEAAVNDMTTSTTIAEITIDVMALNLPRKIVYAPMKERLCAMLVNPAPGVRRAAGRLLGVIAQGSAPLMMDDLDELIPVVSRLVLDPEWIVRESLCYCLGQWLEHFVHMEEHGDQLLPPVMQLLQDPNAIVRERGCYVLEQYCEEVEEHLTEEQTSVLMTTLLTLMSQPHQAVVETALSAVASVAKASHEGFTPYLPSITPFLLTSMQLADPQQLTLRGKAVDCMGHIATAVGKEAFLPFFQPTMQAANDSFAFDDAGLKEYCMLALANIAQVWMHEFSPFLENLVPVLLDCVRERDVVVPEVIGDEIRMEQQLRGIGGATKGGGDEEEEEEEGVDTLRNRVDYRIRTGELDLKASAVLALSVLAKSCGSSFGPYVRQTVGLMEELLLYFHEDVRQNVVEVLWNCVDCVLLCFPVPGAPPAQGSPALALPKPVEVIIKSQMTLYNFMMRDDADKKVVSLCCEAIGAHLRAIGRVALVEHYPIVVRTLRKLLKGKAKCQKDHELLDDEEAFAEHDHVMIDFAADLLGELAMAFGGDFVADFRSLFPLVMQYCSGTRPADDRAMALGIFAEVSKGIGQGFAEFVERCWPVVMQGLSDEVSQVRRNAAFAVGSIVAAVGLPMQPHLAIVCQALRPLLTREEVDSVCDNAAGSMGRLLSTFPAVLPLDQILPVVVQVLPLQDDRAEDMSIFRPLISFAKGGHPAMAPLMLPFVVACTEALADEDTPGPVAEMLKDFVRHLARANSAQFVELAQRCPPEVSRVVFLRDVLQSQMILSQTCSSH